MSATHAATPSTMPVRRRFERLRDDPVPSSIHRSPSSEGCSAPCADVPSSIVAPPLSARSRLWRFTRMHMRVPGQSYRRCERASRVRTQIRKIRYGASDQGEIDPSGAQESGPPRRLEQDPGGRPGLGRVLSEAGLEHPGELVDVPEPLPEASSSTRRKSGTAQQASARATLCTAGSAERQRRPRSVSTTWPDRPATSPKSLALASRLRKAPLRTPL